MFDQGAQGESWDSIYRWVVDNGIFDELKATESLDTPLRGAELLQALATDTTQDHSEFFEGFSVDDYAALNSDLRDSSFNMLEHYLKHGISEKRYASITKLSHDANKMLAAGLFDTEYYLNQLNAPITDIAPAVHYLLEGWKRNLSPSPHFDQALYLENYPAANNFERPPIAYYLEIGRPFRHIVSKKTVGRAFEILNEGDFFDLEHYERQVGHGFPDKSAAIRHYIYFGYQHRYRPNADYCDHTYAERNPDLWEQELPLACHYLKYGRAESRAARPWVGDNSMYEGRSPFQRDRKTVIIVCHEASLTGAPLLGLELVKQYSRTHNVISVLQQGGKIAEEFVEHSWFMVQLLDHANSLANIIEVYQKQTEIEACILNSVECAHFGAASTRHGIPTVTLIHEYSEYVDLLRTIEAVNFSNAIVFPAETVKASFVKRCEEQLSLRMSNLHVAHQGLLSKRESKRPAARWTERDVLLHLDIDPDLPSAKRPPVIVGAGASQLRKGVDLFIQTAAFYKENYGSDIRFVWVGSRKRSDKDIYEAMLDNMVDTLGLRDIFKFIPHQPDLETIFAASDIFYLSSRLDPFPNVFIDAVCSDLDCVAFETISGSAEFIDEHMPNSRTVNAMDTLAAAGAIHDIVLARRSGKRGSAEAPRLLTFDGYVEQLNQIIGTARERCTIERKLAKDITDHIELQPNFVTAEPDMGHLRESRSIQVARGLAYGGLRRSIRAGLDHSLLLNGDSLVDAETGMTNVGQLHNNTHDTLVCYPSLDEHAGYTQAKLDKPIAIHFHLFYWKVIHELLIDYKWAFDDEENVHIYISTGSESDKHALNSLLTWRKNVTVEVVENRGRDILPMLSTFAEPLQSGNYALIGHLHGKKSEWVGGNVGDIWREFCFNHLGGKPGVIETIFNAFEADSELGLLFPEDPNVIGWNRNKPYAEELMKRMGFSDEIPDSIRFPLGTMFWARPAVLTPLWNAKINVDDVPSEPLPEDGTILHAVERLLPLVCTTQGLKWATIHARDTVLR